MTYDKAYHDEISKHPDIKRRKILKSFSERKEKSSTQKNCIKMTLEFLVASLEAKRH